MWLLFQIRISKLNSRNAETYLAKTFPHLRDVLKEPPFNISEEYSKPAFARPANYIPAVPSKRIKILGALLDWLICHSIDTGFAKFRFSTISTRFEDHLTWMQIRDLETYARQFPLDEIMILTYREEMSNEIRSLIEPGVWLTNSNGLAPYSRSMCLVQRSPYSLTSSPFLSTFLTVILGLLVNPRYFYLAVPNAYIEPILVNAVRAVQFLMTSGSSRPLATSELEKVMSGLQPSKIVKFSSYKEYFTYAQDHGAVLNGAEIKWLKSKIEGMARREGTFRDFIAKLSLEDTKTGLTTSR